MPTGSRADRPLSGHRLRGFYQFWCMAFLDVYGWG